MERHSGPSREESYEHVLMCLICRSLFDDHDHQPKFLPCHHTFCKDCLREYVRQMGDEIECPSCRKIANVPAAGVAALQTNFYVKYIQSLVSGYSSGNVRIKQCMVHTGEQLHYYCRDCQTAICKCCTKEESSACSHHSKIALTKATEQSHQSLDSSFAAANATIESQKITVEAMLKALAREKDQSLLKIDSTFEQHAHTLHRRATLLKNKVIDIYNEHVGKLENDLEEVSTALTCIVSLKEYYERKISDGDFKDFEKGVEEMDEVRNNMVAHIRPAENHIVFEEKHGLDKFKQSAKDLGRVRNTRPTVPHSNSVDGYDSSYDCSILGGAGASSNSNVSSPEELQLTPTPNQEIRGFSYISNVENNASKKIPPSQETKPPLDVKVPDKLCNPYDTNVEMLPSPKSLSTAPPKLKNIALSGLPSKGTKASMKLEPASHEASPALEIQSKSSDSTPKMSKEHTPEPCPAGEPDKSGECADGHNCSILPMSSIDNITLPLDSDICSTTMAMSDSMTASIESKGFGGARPKTQTQSGAKPADQRRSHKTRDPGGHANMPGPQVQRNLSHPNGPQSRPPDPEVIQQLMSRSFNTSLPGSVDPTKLSTTDMEKLKSDKEYYHLLYTSYDEEELLKELRQGQRTIEDSDSWLTISSADDSSSGTSTEEIIVVEQEQTSF